MNADSGMSAPDPSMVRLRRNLNRGRTLFTRALKHPTWAIAHLQNFRDQRNDRRAGAAVPPASTHSLTEVLSLISGVSEEEASAIRQTVPRPALRRKSVLYGNPNASSELVALTYGCCRLLRPEVVVETGVANGYTTAAVLRALAENDKGKLISIDLPHLHPQAVESVGAAVAPDLQNRWELHLGPATRLLRRVIPSNIDIFVQDAAHTVRGQLAEYRAAWPYLREGGLLISDDVGLGFMEFALEVHHEPILVHQDKSVPIGVLLKRLAESGKT